MTDIKIMTDRLLLLPMTYDFARSIMDKDYKTVEKMGLRIGSKWPHEDTFDILPMVMGQLKDSKESDGFGVWVIVKRDGMEIIGDAGFKGMPDENGEVEIGYGLAEDERGKGYGSEAAEALVGWAFSHDSVRRINADCLINNAASVRVLQKIGMTEMKRDNELIYWEMSKQRTEG